MAFFEALFLLRVPTDLRRRSPVDLTSFMKPIVL